MTQIRIAAGDKDKVKSYLDNAKLDGTSDGAWFTIDVPDSEAPSVLADLKKMDARVEEVAVPGPDLDDVVIRVLEESFKR